MYRKNKNPFCNEKRLWRSILVRKMASVKLKLQAVFTRRYLTGAPKPATAGCRPFARMAWFVVTKAFVGTKPDDRTDIFRFPTHSMLDWNFVPQSFLLARRRPKTSQS